MSIHRPLITFNVIRSRHKGHRVGKVKEQILMNREGRFRHGVFRQDVPDSQDDRRSL